MNRETIENIERGTTVSDYELGLPMFHRMADIEGTCVWAEPGWVRVYAIPHHRVMEDRDRTWLPNLSTGFGLDWARRLLAKRAGWTGDSAYDYGLLFYPGEDGWYLMSRWSHKWKHFPYYEGRPQDGRDIVAVLARALADTSTQLKLCNPNMELVDDKT